ncbi:hypothetical protein [Tahibacter amnicola]|uniref:Uncharacterized protein n=1 Tax=Tahibacter amnicola TaxID=2976241 RepID=A0ABY6BHD0_9GAMM|nr:hypothetical protein [Tahibacter amnicola]UXI69424.1 hypothetical protein N4264_07180 [Tahibacter amnicola]
MRPNPLDTLRTLLLCLGLAVSLDGNTAPDYRVAACMACAPEKMSFTARTSGPGLVHVWDPLSGDVHRYRVACIKNASNSELPAPEPHAGPLCAQWQSTEEPLPAHHAALTRALSTILVGKAMSFQLDVPVGAQSWSGYAAHSATVYDLIRDETLRKELEDHIRRPDALANSDDPLAKAWAHALAHAADARAYTPKLSSNYRVILDDGSSVQYNLSLHGALQFRKDSFRDPIGNAIPTRNELSSGGIWLFAKEHHAHLQRLLDQMARNGARIVGTPSPGNNRIECKVDLTMPARPLVCEVTATGPLAADAARAAHVTPETTH